MNVYTFDFLTESQDFDHNETFVLESDMIQECSHRKKQIEQLKQQLEEAVELLDSRRGSCAYGGMGIDFEKCDCGYHKTTRFLAKYRGEK